MSGDLTSLFVGGCYRSGTTLLEKLLHHHPEICVTSQPFQDLYFYCKEAFDKSLGIVRRYPLGHLFLEDAYRPEDLDRFLTEYRFGDEQVEAVLSRMATNRLGLWTPEILRHRDRVRGGTFWQIYRQLNQLAGEIYSAQKRTYVGGKEVLCEEYVPHLLARGGRAILVVRDPRDMISSLDFRRRDNMTGEDRPVLFSLRIWRKSVAFCLALEEHPGFLWLRYEDLAAKPLSELARVSDFLALPPFDPELYADGIRHQDGSIWSGNSSFTDQVGVATTSIGGFKERLPAEALAYIEACCRPEMELLGYEPLIRSDLEPAAVHGYRDPFERIHGSFPRDYSRDPVRAQQEIERQAKLSADALSLAEQRRWFIFERAYERLRAACARG